jgi:subtilisin-like proprotein convertase family protein
MYPRLRLLLIVLSVGCAFSIPPPDSRFETDHFAIELLPGTNPHQIAQKHGHELVGRVGMLENIYLFRKKPDTIHGLTHPHHEESLGNTISWYERQIERQLYKRDTPTVNSDNVPLDPLYGQQWHLHRVDALNNAHINVEKAWKENITGNGVVIAVVDDGLEYTHPDLADNYHAPGSFDFNYNDPDPFPDASTDDHGTSAAGVAGARDNTKCGVGSAYRAKLSAIRLISKASTDSQEAGALNYKPQINHIYTNSWGPFDDARRKEGPGRLATLSLQNGIFEGRGGKGSIYVWAGGNGRRSGDNCNYDGWANSRYTISIGAVDTRGKQAWYSESCAMLVASAPSSGDSKAITTSDLKGARGTSSEDCTSSFGGTSAAAPLAAGVVALVLEANPSLTWRDVQGVLIESAAKNDPADTDWVTNGGGYRVNHKYGFGLIDAHAAVQRAKSWTNLPAFRNVTVRQNVNEPIPEGRFLTETINIDSNFVVEHVEVFFEALHRRIGDIVIHLQSPAGTTSILAEVHGDTHTSYAWTFGSIRHWGENSQGAWTLNVKDGKTGETGTWTRWSLAIYGH